MDKKLRIAEIAARTGMSASTVSRVLAGKANTSEKARQRVLQCAREMGVMEGLAAGRMLLNSLVAALVIIPFVAIIRVYFIRHEEVLMEQTFGDEYLCYKESVRRWI